MTVGIPDIAVVIPARDEEATIAAVVAEVLAALIGRTAEVVVVDNGSRDATVEQARAAGARVVAAPIPGYGRACMAGVDATTAPILVFMDGDGSDIPAQIPALLDAVEAGADMALGVRRGPAVEPGSITTPARFGNWLSGLLLAAVYGRRLHDLSPLKAVRRSLLDRSRSRELTYGWTVELLAAALRTHAAIAEVEVGYRRRAGGVSKISGDLGASIRAGVRILLTVGRFALSDSRQALPALLGAGVVCLLLLALAGWLAAVPGASQRAWVAIWLVAWPALLAGVGLGMLAGRVLARLRHTGRATAASREPSSSR